MKSHKLNKQAAKEFGDVCYCLRNMEHRVYLPHDFFSSTVYNQLLPQQSPMMFWAALANAIERSHLSAEQEKRVVELFVKRYAIEEVGKNKGVTGKDLLELADVLTNKIKEQTRLSKVLTNSVIFRMKQLYLMLQTTL